MRLLKRSEIQALVPGIKFGSWNYYLWRVGVNEVRKEIINGRATSLYSPDAVQKLKSYLKTKRNYERKAA
jgi:hypothetical protein